MGEKKITARMVIVTGVSGAGKSQVVNFLEDIGYFCVDNMPTTMIPKFMELTAQSQGKYSRIALVVDVRERDFWDNLFVALSDVGGMGFHYEILFLEARDDVLVRRFSETRRKHPLTQSSDLMENIVAERELLAPLKERATRVVDTSDISVHELRDLIYKIYQDDLPPNPLTVSIIAFGFKNGLPLQADLAFDVRFLPNPHFVADLRPLSGNDQKVVDYVMQSPVSREYANKLQDFIGFLIPHYERERKSYLTIAIGCTGGKHRSVVIANQLAAYLRARNYFIKLNYRDLGKE